MPNNYPYLKFFPADWLASTCFLSASTRGFWIDLICVMHGMNRTGSMTGSVEQFAQACRCSVGEAERCISELSSANVANVTACNGKITIVCRRLQKAQKERLRVREAVRRNRDVTKMLQHHNQNHISEQKKETLCVSKENRYPDSVDAVLQLARTIGKVCTPEQAESYFLTRVSREWIPNGANRPILPHNVPLDLKKWLLRGENEQNKTQNNPKQPGF